MIVDGPATGQESDGGAAAPTEPERLTPELVPQREVARAFAAFKAELRGMCTSKRGRAAVCLEPSEEAELWLRQKGEASELLCYVLRRGAAVDGLVCASLCVSGRHERHMPDGQKVAFGAPRSGRKRARDGAAAEPAAAELLVWHLWVRPSARGHGSARQLMCAVFEGASAEARAAPAAVRVRRRAERQRRGAGLLAARSRRGR